MLENTIPVARIKVVIRGSNFFIDVPIRIAKTTSNAIIGFAERRILCDQLPINLTQDFRLTQGPKLEDLQLYHLHYLFQIQ